MARVNSVTVDDLDWKTEQNTNPEPALAGQDAFCAWPEQLSEAMRWGATAQEALEAARKAAKHRLAQLDATTLARIATPMAQLSIRIPAATKQAIVDRAEAAGMTLTRFVLERCLKAPGASADPFDQLQRHVHHLSNRVNAIESEMMAGAKPRARGGRVLGYESGDPAEQYVATDGKSVLVGGTIGNVAEGTIASASSPSRKRKPRVQT